MIQHAIYSRKPFVFIRAVATVTALSLGLYLPVPSAFSIQPAGFDSLSSGSPSSLDPAYVKIPSELGQIKEIHKGHTDQFVVYIQDAHTNYSAQKNIAAIIGHLTSKYGFDLVAAEGTEGDIDTEMFRAFPIPKVTDRVADRYMRQGRMGGPHYEAITGETPFDFVGIDRAKLYLKNLEEFLAVSGIREEGRAFAAQVEISLRHLQSALFSKHHRRLNRLVRRYREEKMELPAFLLELSKISERLNVNISGLENIASVFAMLQTEKSEALSEETVKSRLESVDVEELAAEIDRWIFTLREKISVSDEERTLIRLEKYLSLLKNGFSLELSRKDVGTLSDLGREFPKDRIFQFLDTLSTRFRLKNDHLKAARSIPIDDDLKKVFSFYETAAKREEIFAKMLREQMRLRLRHSAVLVTGGFHTEGISERLRQSGLSYMIVMPRVEELSDHQTYLRIMRESQGLLNIPRRNAIARFIATVNFGDFARREIGLQIDELISAPTQAELTESGFESQQELVRAYLRDGRVDYLGGRIITRSGFSSALTEWFGGIRATSGVGEVERRKALLHYVAERAVPVRAIESEITGEVGVPRKTLDVLPTRNIIAGSEKAAAGFGNAQSKSVLRRYVLPIGIVSIISLVFGMTTGFLGPFLLMGATVIGITFLIRYFLETRARLKPHEFRLAPVRFFTPDIIKKRGGDWSTDDYHVTIMDRGGKVKNLVQIADGQIEDKALTAENAIRLILKRQVGNKKHVVYVSDSLDWPASRMHSDAGFLTSAGVTFTYDEAGNITLQNIDIRRETKRNRILSSHFTRYLAYVFASIYPVLFIADRSGVSDWAYFHAYLDRRLAMLTTRAVREDRTNHAIDRETVTASLRVLSDLLDVKIAGRPSESLEKEKIGELINVLDQHPSPHVKAVAMNELVQRNARDAIDVITKQLTDDRRLGLNIEPFPLLPFRVPDEIWRGPFAFYFDKNKDTDENINDINEGWVTSWVKLWWDLVEIAPQGHLRDRALLALAALDARGAVPEIIEHIESTWTKPDEDALTRVLAMGVLAKLAQPENVDRIAEVIVRGIHGELARLEPDPNDTRRRYIPIKTLIRYLPVNPYLTGFRNPRLSGRENLGLVTKPRPLGRRNGFTVEVARAIMEGDDVFRKQPVNDAPVRLYLVDALSNVVNATGREDALKTLKDIIVGEEDSGLRGKMLRFINQIPKVRDALLEKMGDTEVRQELEKIKAGRGFGALENQLIRLAEVRAQAERNASLENIRGFGSVGTLLVTSPEALQLLAEQQKAHPDFDLGFGAIQTIIPLNVWNPSEMQKAETLVRLYWPGAALLTEGIRQPYQAAAIRSRLRALTIAEDPALISAGRLTEEEEIMLNNARRLVVDHILARQAALNRLLEWEMIVRQTIDIAA